MLALPKLRWVFSVHHVADGASHGRSARGQARAAATFAVALVLLFPCLSSARDWVVPDDAPTVAAGIDSAQAGDTVTLLPGTYYEHDLVMKSDITLRGSTGDVTDVTIDAMDLGRVMDASYASGTTRLEDITFTGGTTYENGAGIYMDSSYVQVENCRFTSNECSQEGGGGGGVYVLGGGPSFTNCQFDGNMSAWPGSGGGLAIANAGPDVTGCLFIGNSAATDGGGVSMVTSDAVLTSCIFISNTADAGGAVSASDSSPTLSQCTLRGNQATGAGGAGVALFSPSSITLDHTIIAKNQSGGAVYQDATCSATVGCCDVWGNAGGDYIYFLSGQNGSAGNFSEDPLFCGLDASLASCSPCVYAGAGCGQVGALGEGCTGRTWVVPDDAPTIAAAIDSAASCDTVYVTAGTYFEQGLVMKSGLTLRGQLVDPDGSNDVVIDGQAYSQIMTGTGLSDNTLIENITFSYGYTVDPMTGGALHLDDSWVRVRHCDFTDCWADEGGAVGIDDGGPAFDNCAFTGNVATNAGGAAVADSGAYVHFQSCVFQGNQSVQGSAVGGAVASYMTSDVTFDQCELSQNTSGGGAGAIFVSESTVDMTGCAVTGNSAAATGGMLSAIDGTLTLYGCTVASNEAGNGSGLMLGNASSATIDNTIIAFGVSGGAVYCYGGATADLTCCDVYGNDGGDWTACIAGQEGVSGNFSLDPEFYLPAEDDYRLTQGSPCADASGCGLVGALGVAVGQTYVVPYDYETIQEAIDAASYGDTVVVQCGIYDEPNIALKDGVYLTSQTGLPDCVTIHESTMARAFYASGVGNATVVKGFTLTGQIPYSDMGAGMYLTEASPVFEDCIFRGFASGYEGGAMYMADSSAPEFTRCVFDSCSTFGAGGVASLDYSTATFTDCAFSDNEANYEGGAFFFRDGSGAVFNTSTFIGNYSGSDGSAIACVSDMLLRAAAACTLRNSIIAFGSGSAAATYCAGTGSVTLECCDVYGNSGGDYTGCLTGQNGVNGNISQDPLFCGEDNPAQPLSLASNSPCTEANQQLCGQMGAYGPGCLSSVSWDGGGDGTTWEDDYNWDQDQEPGPGDHAVIDLPGDYTVTLNSARTVSALTIGPSDGVIVLDIQSETLTVTETLTNWETIVVRDVAALDAPSAGRASDIVNETGATFQLDDGDLVGSGSFTNRGYFTKTGVGRSYVYLSFLNESGGRSDDGLMDAAAGTLDMGGEFENLGRLNIITGQGTMVSKHYIGREPRAGSGTFVNGGLVDIEDGGQLIALDNTTVTSNGQFNNRGEVFVGANATFYNENGGEFGLNDGDLNGTGAFVNRGYFAKIGPGLGTILLSFTNEDAGRGTDGLVEAGAGTLDVGGEFENLGRLNIITGQGTMVSKHYIRGEARAGSGTFINEGIVNLAVGSFFRANANTDVSSTGEFTVGGLVEVEPGAGFASAGSVEVRPWGRFAAKGTVDNETGGSFVNKGRTLIPAGGTINNYGYFVHQENAILRGSGTFDTSSGIAAMKGVIEPGESPGTLEYIGSFIQTSTSEIRIEIGGYSPGVDYDVLSINGSAYFGGAMELSFVPGFTPVQGDSFSVIVDSGPREGRTIDFGCFSGLDVSDSLYMQPVQRPSAFRFRAVSGSLGNAHPVANDDYAAVAGHDSVSIPVLANDFDPDLDDLIVLSVTGDPTHGEAYVDPGDQSISYFASEGFAGADSFRYFVTDCVSGVSSAMVRLMVTPPPRTWHVPDEAPTIQAGIDSAAVGDTVMVACGVYYETDIALKSGVTLVSETGDPDCVTIEAAGRSDRLVSCSYVNDGALVSGITLRRGSTSESGGIVHCSHSSPAFINCVLDGGFGGVAGGAVAAEQFSAPSFEDCVFTDNYGLSGGAVAVRDSSEATFLRCVFGGNLADSYGGAVYCDSGSLVEIVSCTMVANAAGEGAGIYLTGGGASVSRSIIAYAPYGEGVGCGTGASAALSCTDVYGNYGGDWVGCISGQSEQDGNFSLDPQFCSPDSADYHLGTGSPCADAPNCGIVGALPAGCEPVTEDPDIDVDPLVLELSTSGRALCDSLTVSNAGQTHLLWRIREAVPSGRRTADGRGAAVGYGDRALSTHGALRSLESSPATAEPVEEPAKGERDTRTGARGSGGPDGFGYTWTDSDASGGPDFEWLDISGVGTELELGDDDFETVALPFEFPFYGKPCGEVSVSSNGYLAFGTLATDYTNDPIPSAKRPGNFVAPLWSDLNPTLGGTIHYYYDDESGRFIVQYTNIHDYWSTGTKTFEVVLSPDGAVLFQYLDVSGDLNVGTVGIEDVGGASGLQVVFNAPYLHDELAVLIEDAVPWLTQTPPGGLMVGGSSGVVAVCADPSGLAPGSYPVDLVFESNDPDEPEVVVAVTLTVEGPPDLEVEPEDLSFTVMTEDGTCDTLYVTNAGGDTLHWFVGKDARDPGAHGQPPSRGASKGRADVSSRHGVASSAESRGGRGSGGPDAYGYSWTDSDQFGGPAFEWTEISSVGTPLMLDGDSYIEIALPFEFPFYGGAEHYVRIGSNGILTFAQGGDEPLNAPVPSGLSPNGFIAPFWDDLAPDLGGAVYSYWNGETGEFIVQYDGVERAGEPESSLTFQVSLKDDGSMSLRYLDMEGTLDSATTGIESPSGSVGLPVAFNESYVHDELAVAITPGCPWLIASPWSGTATAGQTDVVSVCVDASALEPGEHTCNLLVRSDDPDSVTVIVPVLAYVVETGVEDGAPSRYELLGNFPNPFNPVTEIRYTLPGPSSVRLEVYDLSGRLLRTLIDGERQPSGRYAVLWDGRDGRGSQVASGVYFYRLVADGEALTRKMILLK